MGSDLTAAVDHLRTLDYVNSGKVGLWVDSHGGWIVLIADSLSNDIDFIINKSGPAVTPLETVFYDVEKNYLDPQKVPETETERILNLYPKIFEYLTRNRADSLRADIKNDLDYFEPAPYFKNSFDQYYKKLLKSPDELKPVSQIPIAPSGRDYDFYPKPYLAKLKTRMFLIYGASDKLIPVAECVDIITDLHNPNIKLKIYSGAAHGMRVRPGPDILVSPEFPDGYLESLADFIKQS